MALNLKIPTSKTFFYKADDADPFPLLRRANDQESPDCTILFRQATAVEVEKRTAALSRRVLRRDDDQVVIVNETNLDLVARLEVFLTLAAADILMPNNEALEFENSRVKSRAQFDKWWDLMPSQWARELHGCCLETNPDWGRAKVDLNEVLAEVEEAVTNYFEWFYLHDPSDPDTQEPPLIGELELYFLHKRYGGLPLAGGLMDQPALTMGLLNLCGNVDARFERVARNQERLKSGSQNAAVANSGREVG